VLGLGALAQSVSLTVTAYSDAVRFSAQGAVKELRVEVLSLSGQKVFDSGPVLGNALDWKLSNTQGQPVANGVYLYTVTVKDPSGNVTKKLGKLAVLRGKGVAAPPLSGITVGELAGRLQPQHAGPGCTAGANQHCGDTSIDGRLEVHPLGGLVPMVIYRSQNRTDCFRLIWNANDAASFGMAFDYMGSGCGGDFGIGDEASRRRLIQSNAAGTQLYLMQDGGLVGIGTTSPGAKTHIVNSGANPGLRVDNSVAGQPAVYINETGGSPALKIDASAGTNAIEVYNTGSGSATGLIFRVQRDNGNVYADGSFIGGGADVAERIDVSEAVEPGDVVEIDPNNPGKFRKAREALSTRVAGVISTAPGVVLGNQRAESNDARPILALAGRVPVKVTAKYGAIAVGDLLVSSPIPGYAMKCPEKSQCIGAVIGKALEPLAEGVGVIEVQVMLR
jgi:hypothetical protein